jgi:tetratricopeptide (TPR) repeat protein
MAHRTYRLSISPEDAPDVRRVFDVDGRSSLGDLHRLALKAFDVSEDKRLYAFFLSGRFWDKQTAYFDSRANGRSAERALLFRIGLTAGKTFAYVLGFKTTQHFLVTVAAVNDVAEPLGAAALVESVGRAPLLAPPSTDETEREDAPSALTDLVPLAERFLDLDDELEQDNDASVLTPPRDPAPLLRASADAALALLTALAQNTGSFFELDHWLLERSLSVRLLDLPLQLADVDEHEQAITLARSLIFIDRELCEGDLAIVLARAGRREEALAQLDSNLERALDRALVEAKAGETHRALGDLPAAEAYYRRSVVESKTSSERLEALLRVASCLMDQGRESEANDVLQQTRKLESEAEAKANPPVVGRNEPCPCGSGKKYKKCHGANA